MEEKQVARVLVRCAPPLDGTEAREVYLVYFLIGWKPLETKPNTGNTGVGIYPTYRKAKEAANRYLKKMHHNGYIMGGVINV